MRPRREEHLVTFRHNGMQDCNHLPFARATIEGGRMTGDAEEGVKRGGMKRGEDSDECEKKV